MDLALEFVLRHHLALSPTCSLIYREFLLSLKVVPLLVIGLFGFAWTSLGPEYTPWIAPLLFAVRPTSLTFTLENVLTDELFPLSQGVIGLANYSVYQTTIDYMVIHRHPICPFALADRHVLFETGRRVRSFLSFSMRWKRSSTRRASGRVRYVRPPAVHGCPWTL